MNKNTKIGVINRSSGSVGYVIPDMNNYHRKFQAGERKELPFEEVQKLAYIPGGDYILQHYLVIENLEARDEILGSVELEYNWTEKDIKNLLTSGSIDSLLDCLDFAPLGVIDLLKKIAVEIRLNDVNKREAIKSKLGFDITKAIEINDETNESKPEEKVGGRRVVDTEATEEKKPTYRRVDSK